MVLLALAGSVLVQRLVGLLLALADWVLAQVGELLLALADWVLEQQVGELLLALAGWVLVQRMEESSEWEW